MEKESNKSLQSLPKLAGTGVDYESIVGFRPSIQEEPTAKPGLAFLGRDEKLGPLAWEKRSNRPAGLR